MGSEVEEQQEKNVEVEKKVKNFIPQRPRYKRGRGQVPLKILPADTMDDAYNRISNTMQTEITCDNKPPIVKNVKVQSVFFRFLL